MSKPGSIPLLSHDDARRGTGGPQLREIDGGQGRRHRGGWVPTKGAHQI
jgi:hypothetical protein